MCNDKKSLDGTPFWVPFLKKVNFMIIYFKNRPLNTNNERFLRSNEIQFKFLQNAFVSECNKNIFENRIRIYFK